MITHVTSRTAFCGRAIRQIKRALNDRSIVIKLVYNGFLALLLADVERAGLKDTVNTLDALKLNFNPNDVGENSVPICKRTMEC